MRFSELDGASVGVWGLGREARSFAEHLRSELPAARVTVLVRENPNEDPSEVVGQATRVVDASAAVSALGTCDVIVRSPGVSIHRPELVALREAGVPVVTATGLWLAERGGRRVMGVTGTKGKSTTATLIAHLAVQAGHPVELAGNIGRPALDLINAPSDDWAVVELSSYQVADLVRGPEVAVVTNVYAEHTDWHGSIDTYRREKLRLLSLPGVETAVINAGDPRVTAAPSTARRTLRFGDAEGWHVTHAGITKGEELQIARDDFPLPGDHNALNLCAALTALEAARLAPPDDLPGAARSAPALAHRLQTVHVAGGVTWVDDSISTEAESAMAALRAFGDRPIVLLGGGQDREQDYGALAAMAAAGDAIVIGLPTTGTRLVDAARAAGIGPERAFMADGMEAAVAAAAALAPPGAAVLLSPAAPSFDRYRNFEERGDHFATLARATARP